MATIVLMYIHALDPPQHSIAPVAPFVGDHELADRGIVDFCEPVSSLGWVFEECLDTGADDFGVQFDILGLACQALIEVSDNARIVRRGIPDRDWHIFVPVTQKPTMPEKRAADTYFREISKCHCQGASAEIQMASLIDVEGRNLKENEMDGIGAGLGALAFWGFIAAVVVVGVWDSIRKREAQHETIRRMIESGKPVDQALMDKLMGSEKRIDRDLRVAGLIVLFAAPGVALLGILVSFLAPSWLFPLLGFAALDACIGIGLLVAGRTAERFYRDDAQAHANRAATD